MALLNVDMIATRACSVSCLYGFIELEQECEKIAVKLSQETKKVFIYELMRKLGHTQSQKLISKCFGKEAQEWKSDYEVESIIDHCRDEDDGQMYYLIKWVDWGYQYNTWEPEHNLYCHQLLHEYKQKKGRWSRKRKVIKQEDQRSLKKRRLDELFKIFKESTIFDSLSPLNILKSYNSDSTNPHMNMNGFLTQLQPKHLRKKKIHHKLLHQEVVTALQFWQNELNSIIKGHDPAPIFVENNVDLEGPPDDFIYINERKEGPGVVIPKDPLIGCECQDCYQDRKDCCTVASGSVLAYKSNGRLRVPRGVPIYECNIRCKCGPNCLNRVIQKGRKFKICIFRTNGRGWGVKALQKIKKGTFVMEYVGEVITNEEAERRGKDYDAVGRTYLFDLDFHDDDAPFSVDAGTYGNAAHFINHSCDPNLEVYVVWINTLDPHLPHICLFAKRDINRNEELTFDYMSGNLPHEDLSADDAHNSGSLNQNGVISNDQTIGVHHFKTLEFTSLKQASSDITSTNSSETHSCRDFWDNESCERDTSSSVIHKTNDLPTPGADAEAVMARDPKDAISVTARDPKDAISVMARDPKDAISVMARDPKDAISVMARYPNDAISVMARDPNDAISVMARDPKDAISVMARDPKDAISVMARDPKDAISVMARDPNDAISVMARDPKDAISVREESKFSMACLCGASNCRKFLFF